MNQTADSAPAAALGGPTIFGQPRGIATLFLTEMWERFTYYGMRALLITFMAAAVTKGGLGINDSSASAIYGLYLGSTYLLGLAGGWLADHLLGSQRAVLSGGFFIMVGNALLALGNTAVFFIGLLVIAMGVGLLKPNVSALVASLYPEGGARRDAGFSIFYMGINLGAFIGSQLVPWFAHWFGWHWGFALPAVGMAIGIAQFRLTRGYLNNAGLPPAAERRGSWTPVIVVLALVAVVVVCAVTGTLRHQPGGLVQRGHLGVRGTGDLLLHLPDLLRRPDCRGAPARLGDGGAVHRLGDVLRRLRAAGRLVQPVRRPLHQPARAGDEHPLGRAAGGEPVLRHHAGAGARGTVAGAGPARHRPAGVGEVRPRADLPGPGVPRHVLRLAACAGRRRS